MKNHTRRRVLALTGSGAMIGLAGCSGSTENENEGGGGQSENNNAPFEIEIGEEAVFAEVESESNIAYFQVLSPEGSAISSAGVSGAATRTKLMDTGITSYSLENSNLLAHPNETLQVVALNSEEEEISRIELSYSPDIDPTEYSVNTEESQTKITLSNVGNGPVSLIPKIMFPPGETKIEQAEVETSGEITRVDEKLTLLGIRTNIQETNYESNPDLFSQIQLIPGENTATPEKIIPTDSQKEFVFLHPGKNFFGITEQFGISGEDVDANASDLDETVVISGNLNLQLKGFDSPVQYNLEVTIDGFNTSYRTSYLGTTPVGEIVYTPKSIEITKIEPK